jgi:hypothetical protein
LKFEPKVYVLLVIDIGYTTLSVYIYKCTREPNRALVLKKLDNKIFDTKVLYFIIKKREI